MKKLLFTVTTLVALSLLAPSTGIAEPTHPNEVGLYLDPLGPDGTGETGTFVIGDPVTVYLVLTRPTDTETGIPYPTINSFECRPTFSPIGNLFKLAHAYPTDAINVGDDNNLALGYLEYAVLFLNDVPVTDESVVLITIEFMHTAPGVIEVTLGPANIINPGFPGQMVFHSVEGQLEVMYSMGGCPECPVFLFDGFAIPVENETFGSVKALYR
jgi:hypothetical protein